MELTFFIPILAVVFAIFIAIFAVTYWFEKETAKSINKIFDSVKSLLIIQFIIKLFKGEEKD